jgi:hypothetical protein
VKGFSLGEGGVRGGWKKGSFQLCLLLRVYYLLFTFQLDSEQLTFDASFVFFNFSLREVGGGWRGGEGGAVFTAESSQFSDMFPTGFPISPRFYPICFGKCGPSFTYTSGCP